MNLREAEERDFVQIWPIFQEIVSAGDTYAYSPETREEEAHRIWMKEPHKTYVAEKEGLVLGTYYVKKNQPGLGSHVCNCGYMVSSRARGQGIASKMCEHSQKMALELGYKAMQYNLVVLNNEGAIRLWKKLGFEVVGHIPKAFCYQGNYVDALVMYKWLA